MGYCRSRDQQWARSITVWNTVRIFASVGRATIVEQYRTVSLRLAVCGAHRRDGEAHCAAHGSLPVRSGA